MAESGKGAFRKHDQRRGSRRRGANLPNHGVPVVAGVAQAKADLRASDRYLSHCQVPVERRRPGLQLTQEPPGLPRLGLTLADAGAAPHLMLAFSYRSEE